MGLALHVEGDGLLVFTLRPSLSLYFFSAHNAKQMDRRTRRKQSRSQILKGNLLNLRRKERQSALKKRYILRV